jgi:hypothetical protein
LTLDDEKIRCATHGFQARAYICQHLFEAGLAVMQQGAHGHGRQAPWF